MSGVNERWSADLLAEWVAALSYADLSETEIAKAEDCILDAIGIRARRHGPARRRLTEVNARAPRIC
jgi:2-methylcitrate dehydratase PrpD